MDNFIYPVPLKYFCNNYLLLSTEANSTHILYIESIRPKSNNNVFYVVKSFIHFKLYLSLVVGTYESVS